MSMQSLSSYGTYTGQPFLKPVPNARFGSVKAGRTSRKKVRLLAERFRVGEKVTVHYLGNLALRGG